MEEKNGPKDVSIQIASTEEGSSSSSNIRQRNVSLSARSPSAKQIANPDTHTPQETKEKSNDQASTLPEIKKWSKWTTRIIIEWIVLVCFAGCLIASLTVHIFKNHVIWGLELWKWCVLVLVTFCSGIFTRGMMNVVVFLMRGKFAQHEMVIYVVYGLRKSVWFFVWLSLVLLTWVLLFDSGVKRSEQTTRILNYITKTLSSTLFGAFLWLIKTTVVKLLAIKFQGKRFFDDIQKAILHQHIVDMLGTLQDQCDTVVIVRWISKFLNWLKEMMTSAWTMEGIDVIRGSRLSIPPSGVIFDKIIEHQKTGDQKTGNKLPSGVKKEDTEGGQEEKVEDIEKEHIEKEHLLSYLKQDNEAKEVLKKWFEDVESSGGIINKSAFQNWLEDICNERDKLASRLNDYKTAIEELDRLLSSIMFVVIVIVWLLMMGILKTRALLLICSQLVLAAFMFGNSLRTVFEAIIFVFVIHPFDVSDRCVIDGVQMVVEEMNLLTTVFERYDNEKIYYPNSVLATKPIANFYRSEKFIGDTLEFAIDVSTPAALIRDLQQKIESYMRKSTDLNQEPKPSVFVKDFDDANGIKMIIYFAHAANFQKYLEIRYKQRSELILKLKEIMEQLEIKYHIVSVRVIEK
ncbi:hypothetical protein SLEP1_g24868 [Rubroshorea leprosula]|uniref:Mechanosensitive ion channel MscS domain-containing protein n=1 Tax=Rubroshorea leprosula TaxID=152421 RepID=A0AAV5JP95_9ROSI|nr:hypothetical protein SLEP1_g24868 [Rubroshorea leprosula]